MAHTRRPSSPTETSPLLGDAVPSHPHQQPLTTSKPPPQSQSPSQSQTQTQTPPPLPTNTTIYAEPASYQTTNPDIVILLLGFSLFCIAGASSLSNVPTAQLTEDLLCRIYYGRLHDDQDGPDIFDDRRCKTAEIQSQLAWLTGVCQSIQCVIGLLVSMPYSILADRIGRRFVFAISSVGSALNLLWTLAVIYFPQTIPVRCMLLAPLFEIIGGGETVLVTMIYSMAASSQTSATRGNAFLRMAVASFGGQAIASLISSRLMESGFLWTPVLVGLIIVPIGTGVVVFIPEALQITDCLDQDDMDDDAIMPIKGRSYLSSVGIYATKFFSQFKKTLSLVKSPSLAFVLFSFLITGPVSLAAGPIMIQYVSERFGWTFAQAGYLLSIRGIGDIFVFLMILPGISKLLMSSNMPFCMSPARKDLALVQASTALITVSMVLLAGGTIHMIIVGLAIMTLGYGRVPLCRSLVASFVDPGQISSVYTLMCMLDTVGMLAAGPTLAWLFSTGMNIGNDWEGLPYIIVSAVCGLATILLCFVRVLPEPQQMVSGDMG